MPATVTHAPDAERAVIACVLLNASAYDDVAPVLGETGDAFTDEQCRAVWHAMVVMRNEGSPIDLLTVCDRVKGCVSPSVVAGMSDAVPTSSNVKYYATTVHEAHMLRDLKVMCGDMWRGIDKVRDRAAGIDRADERFTAWARRRFVNADIAHVNEVQAERLEYFEAILRGDTSAWGVRTGINIIDHCTSGLHPGDLIMLAARPSVGKTAMSLAITLNAISNGVPTLFLSLEMTKEALVERMISSLSGCNIKRYKDGGGSSHWLSLMQAAGEKLKSYPLFIEDDKTKSGILDVSAVARQCFREHGIRLLVIDYIGLMSGSGAYQNSRNYEMGDISRRLKALAGELKAPVLALAQLNREAEGVEPTLSNLRDSGNLEQDADVVVFLHPTGEEGGQGRCGTLIKVAKYRNGYTGKGLYWFDKGVQRFQPADTAHTDDDAPYAHVDPKKAADEFYGTQGGFDDYGREAREA